MIIPRDETFYMLPDEENNDLPEIEDDDEEDEDDFEDEEDDDPSNPLD